LLNRLPDEEGRRFYTELVDREHLSLERLVAAFLDSQEFRMRRVREHQVVPVVLDGFTLHVRLGDKEVGAGVAETREYEPHVTREMVKVLRGGMVFVDVGANVGYFTMLAASRVGAAGKVIAFEPNPDNCTLLRMSLEANGFGNVTLHAAAVSDTVQEFALEVTGSNGALRDDQRAGDVIVRSVVLDACLEDEARVDVIKMDVEGFEGRVLNGMKRTLARHRPIVFTEFSPNDLRRRSGVDPESHLADLVQCGYDLYLLPHEGQRAQTPQSPAEIASAHGIGHSSHLDVVAYPRS
jgi:FkbM family methyltransferase